MAVCQCAAAEPSLDYNRDVLPILSDNCFTCHGPDSAARQAGLRLDQPSIATSELESGMRAIVPGNTDKSELVARIDNSDDSLVMPPIDSGKALTDGQKSILRRWIAEGAHYAPHWAFVRPIRPAVPTPDSPERVANPIDAFVIAKLEQHGKQPAPAASKERLIRRATFDLTGLPPTLKEIDAFLADTSPEAYERVVDRLLESPRYGERMAVDWLDGARFADSNGYQNDFTRDMSPWRDWVIRAFNSHMPYDQFVVEQLAGDLLPNASHEQRIATGFNRNHRTVTEAGSIEEEWLVENVVDRTDTFGTVMLGLTVGCARCHDHKFDPISQREFYKLYAFFNNCDEKGFHEEVRGNVPPLMRVASSEHKRQLEEMSAEVAELQSQYASQREELAEIRDEWLLSLSAEIQSNPPRPTIVVPLQGDTRAPAGESNATVDADAGPLPPLWTNDLFGQAASFADGRQLVYQKVNLPIIREGFSFTILAKPTGSGALLSKMDMSASYRGFDALLLDDNSLAIHLVHNWPGDAIKIVTKRKLPLQAWTHVAVTVDGSQKANGVAVYFNGQRQDVTVEVDQLIGDVATGEPLRIGSRPTEQPFHGRLRNVKFFDVRLSADEVAAEVRRSLRVNLPTDPAKTLAQPLLAEFDDLMVELSGNPVAAETAKLKSRFDAAKKEREEFEASIPTSMIMAERSTRRETYLLMRGNYATPDKSEALEPGVPEILGDLPADAPRNRLGLAQWVVSPANPLTARVMVNRLWQQCFGNGLLKTPENFGVQSNPPVHQELLDWLAVELIESGWNLQHIQRLIVTSNTYRQQSEASAADFAQDPSNAWLSRGPRGRLSAEGIRDNALATSGLLSEKLGGPSVMPYQPQGLWEDLQGGAPETYVVASGPDLYRRSLYTFRKRTVPHPSMATFDAPSWEICQVKRAATDTPLQALALLNDVTYVEAARALAERMLKADSTSEENRLRHAFRLATSRSPSAEEIARLQECLHKYRLSFASAPERALEFISHGNSKRDEALDVVDLAAHTAVASVLLNLDETISKN